MIRSIASTAFSLCVLAACVAAAILLVPRLELGPVLAHFASAALGRTVTVGSLHVVPGRWLTVDLRDLRVADIEGSRPAIVELRELRAEVEASSLLRRPMMIRSLTTSGLSVLLQRRADHTPNWRFGASSPARSDSAGRDWMPTLLDARLSDSDITYRTARGGAFRTRLDRLIIRTADAGAPVRLTAAGAYQAVPVALDAHLRSFDALRDAAAPYGADLHFTSGTTALDFEGSFSEPLDVDGADGRLTLTAPSAEPLLALSGLDSSAALSLRLTGQFHRHDDDWRMSGVTGQVKDNPVSTASFDLTEGSVGKPDAVSADIAFDRLDLNGIVSNGAQRGGPANADIPLAIAAAPDPLIKARLSARQLRYGQWQTTDAQLSASQTPGQIAVQELAATYLGARLRGSGRIDAAGAGGRVSADLAVEGADIEPLRRALGFGPVPLTGKLAIKASASSTGATLNAAVRTGQVSAAVSIAGGRVARQVIEMGSTDIRLLFRKPEGTIPVSCLLGVLDLRAGVGTLLPLRIRTADGTIVGNAQLDLNRRRFDLTIGSQRNTTGAFALDIPVRVFGSFANPTIRPARWSAVGRQMLAESNTAGRLPPGLQPFARQNPCLDPR